MKPRLITFAVLLLSLSAWAQKDVPYGWHRLKPAEVASRAAKDITARVDLDGDRRPDPALFLADDNGRSMALFVYSSSTSRWMKLESSKVAVFSSRRISVVKPGAYATTCAATPDDNACKGGEPAKLNLKHPALDLFSPGGTHLYFY